MKIDISPAFMRGWDHPCGCSLFSFQILGRYYMITDLVYLSQHSKLVAHFLFFRFVYKPDREQEIWRGLITTRYNHPFGFLPCWFVWWQKNWRTLYMWRQGSSYSSQTSFEHKFGLLSEHICMYANAISDLLNICALLGKEGK